MSTRTPSPGTGAMPQAGGNTSALVDQLKKMIARELDVRLREEDIDPTVPLLEGGLAIDSMVLFEFITLIEKRFGFEFSDQNLRQEVFANLNVLAEHILAEQGRRSSPAA